MVGARDRRHHGAGECKEKANHGQSLCSIVGTRFRRSPW
jgi:hypothetical protein